MTHRVTLGALTALSLLAASPAAAQAVDDRTNEEVGLRENFSTAELVTAGIGVGGAFVLTRWGSDLFGDPAPGMGPPDPQSVDWRFTHRVNPNPDPTTQWLRGWPDLSGYLMPMGALAFYGTATVGSAIDPDFPLASRKHELVAFTQALAWSTVTVNSLKLVVGRQRPFAARDDIDASLIEEQEKERFLSFPSGHSAAAAVTAFFVFHDLSDHLMHDALAGRSEALRWSVGYGLPMIGAMGASWVVMYSRIHDQRHWLSDTLVGAAIGAGFATGFYMMHFDDEGRARRRHDVEPELLEADEEPELTTLHLMPSAPGVPLGLSFGGTF